MPDQANDKRPHLVLTNTSRAQKFIAPSAGGGGSPEVPKLDRVEHGASLQAQLLALKPIFQQAVKLQTEQGLQSGLGLQIQFVGLPDVALAFESLGYEMGRDPRKKIEVLSVKTEDGTTYANVFVPDGKLAHFEQYLADYLAERKKINGDAYDHNALINTIASIRGAEIRALWTDEPELLPEDKAESFWWEVWLPARGKLLRDVVVDDFRKLVALAECQVGEHQINFPERTVVLMFGSEQQLSRSVMTLNCVAELRRAKETAEFFDGMTPPEQQEWVDETLARLSLPLDVDATPRVCLLDSGVIIDRLLEGMPAGYSSDDIEARAEVVFQYVQQQMHSTAVN